MSFQPAMEWLREVALMSIEISKVGHLVLRVRDLDQALVFYSSMLGLSEVARRDYGEGPMVFLSTGSSHHDIALVEVGAAGIRATPLRAQGG